MTTTTGSTSNMRETFAEGQRQKLVPQLEQSLGSASIERVVVHPKRVNTVKKCNRNGSRDDVLLNCNIGCKKHTCRSY